MLKPVSCDHVTSNYDGKKARDVGLTCWCHLSNIMPDSIFHESIRQGITWISSFIFFLIFLFLFIYYFFSGVILLFSSGLKRWNKFYPYNISGRMEILSYNGDRQMGLINLQWDSKSEHVRDFRLRITLWGSFVFIWCVVFNQGCCIFIQYILLRVVEKGF